MAGDLTDIFALARSFEYNASKARNAFYSIFEKYDKEFPDDDVVDLIRGSIVRDRGKLRHSVGRKVGCTKHGGHRRHSCQTGDSDTSATTSTSSSLQLDSEIKTEPLETSDTSVSFSENCSRWASVTVVESEPSDAETISSESSDEGDDSWEDDDDDDSGKIILSVPSSSGSDDRKQLDVSHSDKDSDCNEWLVLKDWEPPGHSWKASHSRKRDRHHKLGCRTKTLSSKKHPDHSCAFSRHKVFEAAEKQNERSVVGKTSHGIHKSGVSSADSGYCSSWISKHAGDPSAKRIAPTQLYSGSCRKEEQVPALKKKVSESPESDNWKGVAQTARPKPPALHLFSPAVSQKHGQVQPDVVGALGTGSHRTFDTVVGADGDRIMSTSDKQHISSFSRIRAGAFDADAMPDRSDQMTNRSVETKEQMTPTSKSKMLNSTFVVTEALTPQKDFSRYGREPACSGDGLRRNLTRSADNTEDITTPAQTQVMAVTCTPQPSPHVPVMKSPQFNRSSVIKLVKNSEKTAKLKEDENCDAEASSYPPDDMQKSLVELQKKLDSFSKNLSPKMPEKLGNVRANVKLSPLKTDNDLNAKICHVQEPVVAKSEQSSAFLSPTRKKLLSTRSVTPQKTPQSPLGSPLPLMKIESPQQLAEARRKFRPTCLPFTSQEVLDMLTLQNPDTVTKLLSQKVCGTVEGNRIPPGTPSKTQHDSRSPYTNSIWTGLKAAQASHSRGSVEPTQSSGELKEARVQCAVPTRSSPIPPVRSALKYSAPSQNFLSQSQRTPNRPGVLQLKAFSTAFGSLHGVTQEPASEGRKREESREAHLAISQKHVVTTEKQKVISRSDRRDYISSSRTLESQRKPSGTQIPSVTGSPRNLWQMSNQSSTSELLKSPHSAPRQAVGEMYQIFARLKQASEQKQRVGTVSRHCESDTVQQLASSRTEENVQLSRQKDVAESETLTHRTQKADSRTRRNVPTNTDLSSSQAEASLNASRVSAGCPELSRYFTGRSWSLRRQEQLRASKESHEGKDDPLALLSKMKTAEERQWCQRQETADSISASHSSEAFSQSDLGRTFEDDSACQPHTVLSSPTPVRHADGFARKETLSSPTARNGLLLDEHFKQQTCKLGTERSYERRTSAGNLCTTNCQSERYSTVSRQAVCTNAEKTLPHHRQRLFHKSKMNRASGSRQRHRPSTHGDTHHNFPEQTHQSSTPSKLLSHLHLDEQNGSLNLSPSCTAMSRLQLDTTVSKDIYEVEGTVVESPQKTAFSRVLLSKGKTLKPCGGDGQRNKAASSSGNKQFHFFQGSAAGSGPQLPSLSKRNFVAKSLGREFTLLKESGTCTTAATNVTTNNGEKCATNSSVLGASENFRLERTKQSVQSSAASPCAAETFGLPGSCRSERMSSKPLGTRGSSMVHISSPRARLHPSSKPPHTSSPEKHTQAPDAHLFFASNKRRFVPDSPELAASPSKGESGFSNKRRCLHSIQSTSTPSKAFVPGHFTLLDETLSTIAAENSDLDITFKTFDDSSSENSEADDEVTLIPL